MAFYLSERGDVIQRINEAEVLIFVELAGDRLIGRLDVQIGDVIGEDRDVLP